MIVARIALPCAMLLLATSVAAAQTTVTDSAQPDVIIASDPSFAAAIRELPDWRERPAVRNGRAYAAPDVPFGWFDAPQSLNRLLGVQWLIRLLHPTLFPEPLGPVVKAFHSLYYHRTPTDAQIRALLQAAGLPR